MDQSPTPRPSSAPADLALLVVDWSRMRSEKIVAAGATRLRDLSLGVALGIILNKVDPRRVMGSGFSGLQVYYDRRYSSHRYCTSVGEAGPIASDDGPSSSRRA